VGRREAHEKNKALADLRKDHHSTMTLALETAAAVEAFTSGRYRNGVPDPLE
jgi:hypothetical protein